MEFLSQGDFWISAGIGVIGMFIHFLKKKIKDESLLAIWQFFTNNAKTSIMALLTTLVGVAGYYTQMASGTNADLITVFLIGFTFDSMLNKWEVREVPV